MYVLGYATVPVAVTPRGSILSEARIPVYGDDPRHEPPLVALALNPQMIDYLIDECESKGPWRDDGFVVELRQIRDEMRDSLWARVAGHP